MQIKSNVNYYGKVCCDVTFHMHCLYFKKEDFLKKREFIKVLVYWTTNCSFVLIHLLM